MTYRAPVDELKRAALGAGGLSDLIAAGLVDGLDESLVESVLTEAARFAEERLAPLSEIGDREGAKLIDGRVIQPSGWKPAYDAWIAGGWSALPCPQEFGGQGMPHALSTAVLEIWNAANLSFGLGPLLTQGAIEAIEAVGSEHLKTTYLPKMIDGSWMGTMNLTEPHAGTDLGALKTRSERAADGTYRIRGTKIFITYGEHELTDNIIHLVLARLTDAPAGTKGISLFLVPKFLVNADGSLGARNDVKEVGLEQKLGIHASPTCVMSYGEHDGAIGWLVGEENRGLAAMFIMMNRARLAVGVQGVATAERALQRAIHYANTRTQGRSAKSPNATMARIVEHPNVRRDILTMRALTAASRMICMATARELDLSQRAADPADRARAAVRCALLTPVAKAFSTDSGTDVASIAIQIHGGTGFIEGTGAAQQYRDARILPIYEGTNGVQAIDLVTRKLPLEGGAVAKTYIAELGATVAQLKAAPPDGIGAAPERLGEAVEALAAASRTLGRMLAENPEGALAVATPYLRLFGIAAGGVYLARAALAPSNQGRAAIDLCRFFAEEIAVAAPDLARLVAGGGRSVLEADASLFEVA